MTIVRNGREAGVAGYWNTLVCLDDVSDRDGSGLLERLDDGKRRRRGVIVYDNDV
nr:hypothetical protein [Arthrobacter sp. W4I7]